MKVINLRPFTVPVMQNGVVIQQSYNIKASIIGLLFQQGLDLSVQDVIERSTLADKIDASGPHLCLTEREYKVILKSVNHFKAYSRNDGTLLKRITMEVTDRIPEDDIKVDIIQ
jgi:hypothetical protein